MSHGFMQYQHLYHHHYQQVSGAEPVLRPETEQVDLRSLVSSSAPQIQAWNDGLDTGPDANIKWLRAQDARSWAVTEAGLAALHREAGVSLRFVLCCPPMMDEQFRSAWLPTAGTQCCILGVSIDFSSFLQGE